MIAVTGSIAYDYLMKFNGIFKDHIIDDPKRNLSVSFFAEGLEKAFGGTAGNIAYSLSLLGEDMKLISTIGKDYSDYFTHLDSLGISTDMISVVEDDITASAYILTDNKDNQITSFYGGAMLKSDENDSEDVDLYIISPTEVGTMKKHADFCIEKNIKYIFDPGQGLPLFDKESLDKYIKHSYITIVNEYELSMILKTMGVEKDYLLSITEILIVTLGEKGSDIYTKGSVEHIGVVVRDKIVDPTGCGDAYRSGLIYGLQNEYSLSDSCKIGSIISSYALEYKATQKHKFTLEEVKETFGKY